MKYLQLIPTRRDIRNVDLPARIRDRVIRRSQGHDYRAHLRVNVTEDKGHARLVELDKPCRSAFIKPEIEALALEQRKHIMKERIVVGKLDLAANRNHDQRRLKAFVLLHELRNSGGVLSGRLECRSNRCQPDDRLRSVRQRMAILS